MKPTSYRRYIVSLLLALFVCTLFPAKITTSGPVISLANAQVPGSAAEVALDTWIRGMIAIYQNVPGLQGLTNAGTTKTCVGFWNNATSPRCWVRTLLAVTAAFFMWLGIKFVVLAGASFEYVLKYGVVEFGQTLKSLMGGIEVGWEAMRDIANIVIIGMFVFIAINIILGVKDFGDKKKIARVLIVAVLINFSLLFTKAIVDASNFVAFQFYKSMVKDYDANAVGTSVAGATTLQTTPGTTGADGGVGASSDAVDVGSVTGIAGRFLKMMRIEGFADSYNAIVKIQEEQRDIGALGYALLMLILLVLTAIVFFYGTYLLITRAILIVFLLLISAVAFASWLIPHHFIEEGWLKWWKALLKSAFLAPILMAFLWATYNVSDALSSNPLFKGGSLGDLATNASKEGNLAALFSFFLILGLLYASFKASSDLAGSISGFTAIGTAVRNAAFGIPALAWRFGVAPLARQTIGRIAYEKRQDLIGKGRLAESRAGELERSALQYQEAGDHVRAAEKRREAAGHMKEAGYYAKWQDRAGKWAGSGFNLGDVGLVKQVAKVGGISELVAGQRGKEVPVGYQQAIEKRIESAEKAFKPLEVSPSQREKIMQDTRQEVFDGKVPAAKKLLDVRRDAQAEHETASADAAKHKNDPELKFREAQQKILRAKIESDHQARMAGLTAQYASAPEDDKERIGGLIQTAKAEFNTKLNAHDAVTEELLEPLTSAQKKLDEAAGKLNTASKALNTFANEEGQRRVRDRRVGSVGAAELFGQKKAGILYTATGMRGHVGKELASKVRGRVGREGRLSQMLARLPDDGAADGDDEA